jgi:hypothetical protein
LISKIKFIQKLHGLNSEKYYRNKIKHNVTDFLLHIYVLQIKDVPNIFLITIISFGENSMKSCCC